MKEAAQRCLLALFAAAGDGAEEVRGQVIQSVRLLAAKDLCGVLALIHGWFVENKPSGSLAGASTIHRYNMCRVLVEVLRAHATPQSLPAALIGDLSKDIVLEVVAGNDVNSEWSQEACAACLCLCDLHPAIGTGVLLEQLPLNALPHNLVMKTMADFATASPTRFVPFLREWLARLLPILGLAKQDNHRIYLAQALTAFADAVNQLAFSNEDLTPRSAASRSVGRGDFAEGMYTALNVLLNEWAKTGEARVRGPVFGAVGMLSCLLADAQRIAMLPKVVPAVIAAIKKDRPREQGAVARGAAAIAVHCSPAVSTELAPHVEPMLQCIVACLAGCQAEKPSGNPADAHALKTTANYLCNWAEGIADGPHMDAVLAFLSKSLDAKQGSKDPVYRTAALGVLRHLVSRRALDARVGPFKDSVVAVTKLAIADTDWRVRRALLGVVVAFGTSTIDFFSSVGAAELVTFVVRQAGISDRTIEEHDTAVAKRGDVATGSAALGEVRDNARGALIIFASLPSLDRHLWPKLFEHMASYIAEPELVNAFPTVSRAVIPLAERMAQTDDFYIDFRVSVNLPKPGTIAAVCLVHALAAGNKQSGVDAAYTLKFMSAIAPLLDEPFLYQHAEEVPSPVASLWLGTIPELLDFAAHPPAATANPYKPSFAGSEWEDVICKLVTRTVAARSEAEWVEQFINASVALLPVYAPHPLLVRANLLVAGIALSKTTRRDLVVSTVDTLVDAVDHAHEELRSGLTKGLSFVASNKEFADIIIEKCSALAKGPEKKSFFSFGKKESSRKELTEHARTVAALSMCWMPRRMNTALLLSRFDTAVVPIVLSVIHESPVPEIQTLAVQGLMLMESALKKAPGEFIFKSRDAILEELLALATQYGAGITLTSAKAASGAAARTAATVVLSATRALTSVIQSNANPPVAAAVFDKLVSFVVQILLPMRADDVTDEDEATVVSSASDLAVAMLMNSTANDVDRFTTPVLSYVSGRPGGVSEGERLRVIALVQTALTTAKARVEAALASEQPATCILSYGSVVGKLCPRVLDNSLTVRPKACAAIATALEIMQLTCHDTLAEVDVAAVITSVADGLAKRAVDCASSVKSALEKEMAAVAKQLCGAVVQVFFIPALFCPLLDALLHNGLVDPQPEAAACACVVLHGVVRGVGSQLSEAQAKTYLETMVQCVDLPLREAALNGLLVSIRNLAKHHSVVCFNAFLRGYPLPHAKNVVTSVQSVGSDGTLSPQFVAHCLDTILNTQLSEDGAGSGPATAATKGAGRNVSHVGTAAACCLAWMSQTAKGAEVIGGMRCPVIGGLALFLSAAHEYGTPERIALVAEALKITTASTSVEATQERMERLGWGALTDGGMFPVAVGELCKYLCIEEINDNAANDLPFLSSMDSVRGLLYPPTAPTQVVVEFAEFMLPYVNKPQRCHRRIAVAVCGRLLRLSVGEESLLQSLASSLLGRTGGDEDLSIRVPALNFFIDVLEHSAAHSAPLTAPVLSALLSNFDDPAAEVAHIAMMNLAAFGERLPDKAPLRPMVVNVLLKIKAKFENPIGPLRAASYALYASLLRMTIRNELDPVTLDQHVHIHLPTVLMHIEDDDDGVSKQCRTAFAHSVDFIARRHLRGGGTNAKAVECITALCTPSGSGSRFDELANDFALAWIAEFPGFINDLLIAAANLMGHDKEGIRAAAASTCGFLIRHMPAADLSRASTEQVCSILIAASSGRERCARVRLKAAKALGMLPVL